MSLANRLYDRPHPEIAPMDVAMLYVDGTLPATPDKVAYRGTLDIHNAIGACQVQLLSGDLPPGATVGVDNGAHQVVVKWPAFQTGPVAVPNGDFELGDDGSYDLGAGWTIMSGVTAPDPNNATGTWQAQFANVGGTSELLNRMRASVTPGQTISASVDVQQGASSENSAGAAVRVVFEDASGNRITNADGNVIKSGSNSEWHTSSVTTMAPAGAVYVRVGAAAFRRRQNAPLWVDHFTWNATQALTGTDEPQTIPLSLRVTDSTGRTADWSGSISVVDTPDFLGYWPCDEASGTVLHDRSGNGHDGVINVGAGVVQGAAPLRAGSNGSLQATALVNAAASVDITGLVPLYGPWTLEAIGQITTPGSIIGVLVALAVGTVQQSGSPDLGVGGTARPPANWCSYMTRLNNDPNAFAGTASPGNQPSHLLLAADQTDQFTGHTTIRIYVNGALAYSGSRSYSTPTGPMYLLGSNAYASSYSAVGRVSDVALYASAVDDAQASAMAARYGFA